MMIMPARYAGIRIRGGALTSDAPRICIVIKVKKTKRRFLVVGDKCCQNFLVRILRGYLAKMRQMMKMATRGKMTSPKLYAS